MKKLTCLVLALLLCLTAVALAENTPSRMTSDLTTIEAKAENMPANSAFFIAPVVETSPAYAAQVAACTTEVAKLAASANVETYFGKVTDSEGNAVSLKDILGTDTLNVYEFSPLVAGEYEESYGKVVANMLFATPYGKDEKVVVMIGIVTVDANGNQVVTWTAYEGVGLGTQANGVERMGAIQVELDPAIVKAIQEGTALMAVVSK